VAGASVTKAVYNTILQNLRQPKVNAGDTTLSAPSLMDNLRQNQSMLDSLEPMMPCIQPCTRSSLLANSQRRRHMILGCSRDRQNQTGVPIAARRSNLPNSPNWEFTWENLRDLRG
jgi:hypothetical protein